MKRLLLLTTLLLFALDVSAERVSRQYGVPTTVTFEIFEVDGVDHRVDAVHAAGDTTIQKDEGAAANTGSGFVDEGDNYSIELTATEMEAARIVLKIVDQTATKVWLDRTIHIETYGDVKAQDKARGIASGVAQSATTTTIVLDAGTSLGNDIVNNSVIYITNGTGIGQRRLITDWVESSDTASVATWTVTPDSTSEYVVIPHNQASVTTVAEASGAATWDALKANHTTVGSFGEIGGDIEQIEIDTSDTLDTRQATILSLAQTQVVYGPVAIETVTSQTQFDVAGSNGPSDDDIHIGKWLCIEDAGESIIRECKRLTDYDSSNNRWTIAEAPFFTVEIGDTIWIPVPPDLVLQTDEITADVIQLDAIGSPELAASAVTEITDDIMAEVIDGTINVKCAFAQFLAYTGPWTTTAAALPYTITYDDAATIATLSGDVTPTSFTSVARTCP